MIEAEIDEMDVSSSGMLLISRVPFFCKVWSSRGASPDAKKKLGLMTSENRAFLFCLMDETAPLIHSYLLYAQK